MFDDALKALASAFSPPFRAVLWKTIGLVVALFAVVYVGLQALFAAFLPFLPGWADALIGVLTGLGLAAGLVFFAVPVTALVAGLFLDEIADAVERRDYPADPPGRALPVLDGLWQAVRFALVALGVNLLVLLLLLVPGVNIVAFFIANGYLLGREYFELVALRHRPPGTARALRADNAGRLFFAGVLISGLLAIPLVNLLTPLVATAFMVHLFKRIEREGGAGAQAVLSGNRQ